MGKKLLFGIFLFVSWPAYGMEQAESPSPEPTDCPPNVIIDTIIVVQRGHIENLHTEYKSLPNRLRQEEKAANESQEKFPPAHPFAHHMGLCRKKSTLKFLYTLPQKHASKKP